MKIILLLSATTIALASLAIFFLIPNSETILTFSGETFFQGDIYRLFTFPFTHIGSAHLIENLIALLITSILAYEVGLRGSLFAACFLISSFLLALTESPFFPTLLIAGASVGIISILGFISIKGSNFIPKYVFVPILLLPLVIKYTLTVMETGFGFVTNAEFVFHLSGFIIGIAFYYSLKTFKKHKQILQTAS